MFDSDFMSTSKLNDLILWHASLDHVYFKRMQDMSKDGLILAFDMDIEKEVVRLLDPKLKTLGERGIECIFSRYVENSKAFNVIEPNESISINTIIESKDVIFDENRFSSVPRLSLRIPNETEDIGGFVVPKENTKDVVQQPEPGLRKSKRNMTPKNFGPEFQLYLIERKRDEKEAINDEMDSIMGNNTWVLADLPPGCKPLGCKWIFKRKLKVDGTIEKFKAILVIQGFRQKSGIYYVDTYALVVDMIKDFLSSRFSMKDMREADVILVSTPMDTSEKLMPNNGQVASQLKYYRASKKQTCITSSIMEYEFADLAATGKEAEWLRNLIFEIPLWSKPIAPISIRCDSVATLAKAYSQIYNGKSRHLADHLKNGLDRDLVIKFAEGMCLKSKMCLEPAGKEDEVFYFLMVNVFEKVLSRSMNTEEPPILVASALYSLSSKLKDTIRETATLGEAFSLAHITEAYFEDERFAITIAKPNNLNTRIQVQDLQETICHKPNKVEAIKTSMVATSEEHEHQENQDNLNEVLKKKMMLNHQFLLTLLTAMVIRKSASFSTLGKNGIGDVLDLLDSRGANNFAQPNASPGSEVVTGLMEEFQEGDMIDALSRVLEQKSSGNWKELDNESENRKVERDVEREGEPTILATFGSDRGITIWDPEINFFYTSP
ncbi:zinc finger, CCHC-type containing protein [Tanacetum coccineum]